MSKVSREKMAGEDTSYRITDVRGSAYAVPTDKPEADGTFEWNSTTIVIAEISAGNATGIGYTYSSSAAALVIHEHLAPAIAACDAMDISGTWDHMVHAVRNIGRPGIASAAISAVDAAMWDLKGKLLDLPVVEMLGAVRNAVSTDPADGRHGCHCLSSKFLESNMNIRKRLILIGLSFVPVGRLLVSSRNSCVSITAKVNAG